MPKLVHLIFHEFKKALPPTIFFLVVFHVSMFIGHLDEESLGITVTRSGAAMIGALVLGKIYLLLDERRFVNLSPGTPLVHVTLWKTFLYAVLASVALFLEELIPLAVHHSSLCQAFEEYKSKIIWPRFWANHILLILWVLVYCVVSGLIRIIGKDRVISIYFFGNKSL